MIDRPAALQLFARQFGVATIAQLVDAGVSSRHVTRAISTGVLVTATSRVVRLASHELSFEARAMAGWLHCGPRSFVSGPTAGRLHGLRYMPRGRTHITALNRTQVTVPVWLDVSRTTWMIAGDVIEHPAGFMIAHPLRLLHELAGAFHAHRFERAAEDAWHLGLVTPQSAADYLERMWRQGRTGVTRLSVWLADASQRTLPAHSGLEMDAIAAFRAVGLPAPVRQFGLLLPSRGDIHIDLAWPEVKLGVEPGHSWFHGGVLGQRDDQARDRECSELGWLIVRFDESMREDLPAAGRQVKRIYDSRRADLSA